MKIKGYFGMGTNVFLKRKSIPASLILFVTSKCNARCTHCFNWKSLNKSESELTLDEIKSISSQLKKLRTLSISGGEPFLRDDLVEICEIFSKNNKTSKIHIPTNGILTGKIRKSTEEIVRKCPNSKIIIALSLDGPREIHNKIRKMDCFDKVIETYNSLNELKKYPNFEMAICTVISNQNYQNIPEIINFVKEKMENLDRHEFELVRGKLREDNVYLPDIEELRKIKNIIGGRQYSKKPIHAFKSLLFDINLKVLTDKKQLPKCIAPYIYLVINELGDVSFCELTKPIGNIRKNTIKEILSSKKARLQMEKVKNKECYCTHGCFQPSNIIFNPSYYPRLIKYLLKSFVSKPKKFK